MHPTVKVAAAQLAPHFLDRQATLDKAARVTLEAAAAGAKLIAFPEAFVPGYPYWSLFLAPTEINDLTLKLYEEAVDLGGDHLDTVREAAKTGGCHVVLGLHERDGGTLYNGQVFIGPDGEILYKRRKLVPTAHERMSWGRGNGRDLGVVSTQLGTLGALICYEHANALFRYAVQAQGEQIHIANWPGGLPSINGIIDAAARSYAFEAGAFVINVTSVLTDEALAELKRLVGSTGSLQVGGGNSSIIAPRGDFLAGPVHDAEQILYADLDFRLITKTKSIVDTSGHYARPDVVRLLVETGELPTLQRR